MKIEYAVNGYDYFIHEISGEVGKGAEVIISIPPELCSEGVAVTAPKNAGILRTNFKQPNSINGYFRKQRVGVEEGLCVEVINPYPWSKKALICNHPVSYVSRRGWIEGIWHLIISSIAKGDV